MQTSYLYCYIGNKGKPWQRFFLKKEKKTGGEKNVEKDGRREKRGKSN